jgi:adenylyl-sulfate kinase
MHNPAPQPAIPSQTPPPHSSPAHLFWQDTTIGKAQRSQQLRQTPLVVWLTGLSGAGKTTLAVALEAQLHQRGHATYLLDGDNIRHGLCHDLGFSEPDRAENVRRVGEVARLMVDAGLIVVVAFISPSHVQRDAVRARFEPGEFHEVFVSTPLHECERRDPKGLYRLARSGQVAQFTGISAPYDEPRTPELRLDTTGRLLADCVQELVNHVLAQQTSNVAQTASS